MKNQMSRAIREQIAFDKAVEIDEQIAFDKAVIARKTVAATLSFDLTPTWSGLMPALIAAAGNGSQGAIDELMNLAATVDRLNAANKQAK